MAEDRGGLNYRIAIRDEFTKSLRDFRDGLREAKAEFKKFKRDTQGGESRVQEQEFKRRQRFAQAQERILQREVQAQTFINRLVEKNRKEKLQGGVNAEKALQREIRAQEYLDRLVDRNRKAKERAAKVAERSAREELRLRERQARADNRAGVSGQSKARQVELDALRADILARAKESEQADRAEGLRISELAKRRAETEKLAVRLRKAAEKEREQADRAEGRRIFDLARKRADAERLAVRLRAAARKEQAARDAQNPEVRAERQINAELLRRRTTLAQIAQLRKQGAGAFLSGDFTGGRDAILRAAQLEKSLNRINNQGNNLLFTFRRLFGVLALFALTREAISGFNQLVANGVKFNDTIASAEIGIAGLVSTLADVRGATGQSVGQAEEFGLAIGVAREQIRLLRQDSLASTATFEQLLDTFQTAIAPGLAAGLDLDEIRLLSVQISQAATAIGLPQNQLAEEIRSLLSGTIQARTTRIATSLGITNADIRRLKETGELADFLEDRLEGFSVAAEKAARSTLSGLRQLTVGAVEELLGNAAKPLFDELLSLGNEVFDEFLTIRDAAGNIKPSPEALAAFRGLFETIRDGVRNLREFARGVSFRDLQSSLDALGFGLSVAFGGLIGAAKTLLDFIRAISDGVNAIAEEFGFTRQQVISFSSALVGALVSLRLMQGSAKLLGINIAFAGKAAGILRAALLPIASSVAAISSIFLAIGFAIDAVLERIFSVNLSLQDTIELITVGLAGAFVNVSEFVQKLATNIVSFIGGAIDTVVTRARLLALEGEKLIAAGSGNSKRAEEITAEQERIQLEADNSSFARRRELAVEIADIESQAAAKQLGLQERINSLIGKRAGEQARGDGFDANFVPATGTGAVGAISNANTAILGLGESLAEVNAELLKAKTEFSQAFAVGGAEGLGGSLQAAFSEQEVQNLERLRETRSALLDVERQINEERQKSLVNEGLLNSLLRDQTDLQDALTEFQQTTATLAASRAAAQATQALPGLTREVQLLQAQLDAEKALTAAQAQRLPARFAALSAAQSAVALAEREAELQQRAAQAELDAARQAVQSAQASGVGREELNTLQNTLFALRDKLGTEQAITEEKLRQLRIAQDEADLVANGGLDEGLTRGLENFANEFSSQFSAGLAIATEALNGFVDFASNAIVDAFDPTKEVDLVERFARLMQQIAQTILSELLKIQIAKTIAGFGVGGVHDGGHIGYHDGGPVTHRRAKGYSRGGGVRGPSSRRGRPRGLHPKDTIPAWLQRGEFVVRERVVRKPGVLEGLEALNSGEGAIAPRATPGGLGMAGGGLATDRLSELVSRQTLSTSQGGSATVTALPVLVAGERNASRIFKGGSRAYIRAARTNRSGINAATNSRNQRR